MKSEGRRSKAERRPKPEPRSGSGFGLRISELGLLSAFGLRASDFKPTSLLSPEERENYRPRGDKSRPPDLSHDDRQSTLSRGRGRGQARLSPIGRTRRLVARPAWLLLLWGEGGVRGNGAAGLTLPPKRSLARVRPSLNSERQRTFLSAPGAQATPKWTNWHYLIQPRPWFPQRFKLPKRLSAWPGADRRYSEPPKAACAPPPSQLFSIA